MLKVLKELEAVIEERAKGEEPGSYTFRLLTEGSLAERKLNEEAYEAIEAAFKKDRKEIVSESADLLFHFLVFLRKYGISLDEIESELERRRR